MLLDLQNRATILRFLDIYPEESPIIPYEYKRKYVYGSLAGHVVVTGNTFEPKNFFCPFHKGTAL